MLRTCVVFPEPVSPTSTIVWCAFSMSMKSCRCWYTGSVTLFVRMSLYRCEYGLPVHGFVPASDGSEAEGWREPELVGPSWSNRESLRFLSPI